MSNDPESDGYLNWTPRLRDTSVGTRYLTSTYLVLNALEHGSTDAEKGYALFAELMRDFILGLVAGLMTTISVRVLPHPTVAV